MATKELLTGINYYRYHFVAALTFGAYAAYHYFFGNIVISAMTGMASASTLGLILSRMFGRDSAVVRESITVAIVCAIFSACFFLGVRGIAWLFPLVVGIFFNYETRNALIISFLSVIVGLLLSLNQVEPMFAARLFFPLAFVIGFACLYRFTIDKERRALEKEANEDHLTGIFNRRSFQRWLQRAVSDTHTSNEILGVFYLDIDDFKQINDTHGHDVGDRILTEISRRLVESMRQTDAVGKPNEHQIARIAGDEFVVAASSLKHERNAQLVAARLLSAVNKTIDIEGLEFKLSTSIGVAMCLGSDASAEDLLRDADAAMYRSKERGKNRITYFDEAIAKQIAEKQKIAKGVEEALKSEAFFLHFMPIFRLAEDRTTSLAGAEVLVRCESESLSGIGPDQFIPVAEEFGSIKEIDLYVIEKAFCHLKEVRDRLPLGFVLAINISAKELYNEVFPDLVASLAMQYAIPFSMIEFEITETSLIEFDERCIELLNSLKEKGFSLSLDDFGTGYTAFSQLNNYPVDTLKIDRSFVWNITANNQDQELMVDVILSLAKLYKLRIIAEGVEDQLQLDYLAKAQCDYLQGFYLSKPLPWKEFVERYVEPVF